MKDLSERLSSRKFVLPIIFAILVILNRRLELNLSENDLQSILTLVGAFIIGETVVDFKNAGNTQPTTVEIQNVEGSVIAPQAEAAPKTDTTHTVKLDGYVGVGK